MKKSIIGISTLTLTVLYGLLAAIIILAFLVTGGDVLVGILISLVVLVLQFFISPWLTDLSMRWLYRAKFGEAIPDYLQKFIEEQCRLNNVTYPRIAIIHDGAPNAFTYGRTKKDARLVLTEGIFNLLSEDEVKAVVAHEIGHIVHYDMIFMTAAQAVPLILYAIYEITAGRRSSRSDKDDNKAAIIGYVAYILYLISQYIILYLSRTREYFADSFSIEATKNPNSLAEALVKIGFGLSTSSNAKSTSNALGIFDVKSSKSMVISCMKDGKVDKGRIKNAMKWEMWNPWAKWFEFNSTHPLISKRLLAITKRSKEYNQEPYVVFDLKKTESYVDDFLLEILLVFAPIILLIATGVIILVMEEFNKLILCGGLFLSLFTLYLRFVRSHRNSDYKATNVSELLSEVKVSHVTSIPCTLEGNIIGRGNPGCIFNEDFVIKDETGIIFLDYNQPLNIANKIFALFRSEKYFNKNIKVTGWYRRSPVPYVEIKTYEVDGKVKKIWTYPLSKALYIIGFIALAIIAII
jgi:heat shock protein HtpX